MDLKKSKPWRATVFIVNGYRATKNGKGNCLRCISFGNAIGVQ